MVKHKLKPDKHAGLFETSKTCYCLKPLNDKAEEMMRFTMENIRGYLHYEKRVPLNLWKMFQNLEVSELKLECPICGRRYVVTFTKPFGRIEEPQRKP